MKLLKQCYIVLLLVLLAACQHRKTSENHTAVEIPGKATDQDLGILADSLAQRFIIVDGHVDLPEKLVHKMADVSKLDPDGEFDFPRAKRGGLNAPFMSIFVPASYQNNGAKKYAFRLINIVKGIAEKYPEKFALANSPEDVRENFNWGLVSLPMGMENGAPIEGDLDNIPLFYQAGIRYITLTHSKDNEIGDSSYDTSRTWGGLSPFGHQVVAAMNRTGIMVDISHVSDSTFYQVIRTTKAPVIASHSSCRFFTPGLERNMSDDMIRKLAANGGVMMINFGSFFLSGALRSAWDDIDGELKKQHLNSDDSLGKSYIMKIAGQKDIFGNVQLVADHIDHAVKIAGIDHVGLGSDFDGVGLGLPNGLKDVSQYPNLIKELLKRGYSPSGIAKICGQNLLRVWEQVGKTALDLQKNPVRVRN